MSESQKTVLLVDDDKFLLDMYSMKFTKEKYTVQACLSVRDAVASLRQGFAPAAVLFDLVMPDGDGFSLLEALRSEKLAQGAVKIALTNQSTDEERQKALSMGADEYIVKASMIPSDVVNTVGELLRKHARA